MHDFRCFSFVLCTMEQALSELPLMQECANEKLQLHNNCFRCRLLPAGIVEVFNIDDPLTVEFHHDTNSPTILLGKRAARMLDLPAEINSYREGAINQVLRDLIFNGFPSGYVSLDGQSKGYLVWITASMMLEPARRIPRINRRGEA